MLKWERVNGLYQAKGEWKKESDAGFPVPAIRRAKVPGGWLVAMANRQIGWVAEERDANEYVQHAHVAECDRFAYGAGFGFAFSGITFVPDQNHEWTAKEYE